MRNPEQSQADAAAGRRAERALRALVTNYLHALSERHGGARRAGSIAPAGATGQDNGR